MEGRNFDKNRHQGVSKVFRPGFTLIEMLIVIVIVGILALMAISSFGSARQHARLDVAVDSIISTIKEQQGNAKNGRQTLTGATGGGSSPQQQSSCYGVVIQKTAPYFQTVTMPYVAVSADSPDADFCDTQKAVSIPVDMAADVQVDMITQGSQANLVDQLAVLFKPPFAAVLEISDLHQNTAGISTPTTDQNPVRIFLNQQGNSPQDERVVQFDANSHLVQKVAVPTSDFATALPASPVSP